MNDTTFIAKAQKVENEFMFSVPFINTYINPNDQNYKELYLEDQDIYTFTTTEGI